jgi:tripartite-type tricarboxylate transporter receptor subunit TctC
VSTFKDLVVYGRAQPGKLYFSSPGTGSLQHLGWEIVMQMSGARYTHVPYKSGAPAITATIAGETQFGFGTLISLRPHMTSGRLRVIAVTSKQRAPTLPDVPTIAESGLPGYEVDQWYGTATSARVPAAVVNKLNADIVAAVKSPDVAQRLAADGSTAVGSSVEHFSAKIRAETAMWRKVAKETGLVLN